MGTLPMKTKLYPVVALCAFSFFLSGQSNTAGKATTPTDTGDRTRITLDVSRVNMLYTVSDKKGRFVTNLTKDDFEVFESKKGKPLSNSRLNPICRCALPS